MRNLLLSGTASIILFGGMLQPSSAEERWLRVYNQTTFPLCEIYISHVGTDDWQEDRIGSCIAPDRYRTVDPGWQEGYCKMDMQFILENGSVIEESDFNICEEEAFYVYDVESRMFDH